MSLPFWPYAYTTGWKKRSHTTFRAEPCSGVGFQLHVPGEHLSVSKLTKKYRDGVDRHHLYASNQSLITVFGY